MKRSGFPRFLMSAFWVSSICASTMLAVAGCALKESGYGVGAQAERAAAQLGAQKSKPDTPGIYLALIDRMQAQGLYYASLAHIDAYEKRYGPTPDTTLLRADALRVTGQSDASALAYRALLATPLAARGHRGLGLIAGETGDFAQAQRELEQAAELAPTDAATLSDLGYARLRAGDIAGARVPLMKAAELDRQNGTILSNLALLLLAEGRARDARGLMDEEQFTPSVREAINVDAHRVADAARAGKRPLPIGQIGTRERRWQDREAPPPSVRKDAAVADVAAASRTTHNFKTPAPLLERFAQ